MFRSNLRFTHVCRTVQRFLVVTFLSVMATTGVNAASFDCALASSRIENAICASPKLSKLDSDLEPSYLSVLGDSKNPEAIKAAQRTWLKDTRDQCQDEACLVTVYQQRIAALDSVASKEFLDAKANVEAEEQGDANAEADAKLAAAEKERMEAEQAAASAAQAKKLAEQAAASAAQAQKLIDEAAAEARHSADQQRLLQIAGGSAALCLLFILAAWLWMRRRKKDVKPADGLNTVVRESMPQPPRAVASASAVRAPLGEALVSGSVLQPVDRQQALAADAEAPVESKPVEKKGKWVAKFAAIALLVGIGLAVLSGVMTGTQSPPNSGATSNAAPATSTANATYPVSSPAPPPSQSANSERLTPNTSTPDPRPPSQLIPVLSGDQAKKFCTYLTVAVIGVVMDTESGMNVNTAANERAHLIGQAIANDGALSAYRLQLESMVKATPTQLPALVKLKASLGERRFNLDVLSACIQSHSPSPSATSQPSGGNASVTKPPVEPTGLEMLEQAIRRANSGSNIACEQAVAALLQMRRSLVGRPPQAAALSEVSDRVQARDLINQVRGWGCPV